jgi:hypothetical protein
MRRNLNRHYSKRSAHCASRVKSGVVADDKEKLTQQKGQGQNEVRALAVPKPVKLSLTAPLDR